MTMIFRFVVWNTLLFAVLAGNNKFRRVCYYSSWAIYRPTTGKFSPSDIDPFLCTHIIYAFGKLNEETFTLETFDPWADLDDNYGLGGYSKVTGLKLQNSRLKVLLSVGGWNAGSSGFSNMVLMKIRRKTFIESAVKFLRKYNFDGLDINWEFPGLRGGRESDKGNYDLFVQDFRAAIDSETVPAGKSPLLLSAAVSASEKTVETAYNPSILTKSLDFISIMSYDFHGSWDTEVQHHSPIYGRHRDPNSIAGFNMVAAVKLWLGSGCPADKIVVGLPFYGRSFTLADAKNTTPGSLAAGGGETGPFSREPGFLAYFEICSLLMDNSWTVITDVEERTPYAFNDKGQWIGYDDIDSVIKKTVIVREWGLGGVMIWSVDMDDFRGLCTSQTYPLLRMIKRVLEFQPVRVLLPAYPISSGFLGFPSDRDLRALPPATSPPHSSPDTPSTSINPVIIVVKARPVQATTPEAMIQVQAKSFLLHEHHHQHQPPSQPLLNPPRLAAHIPQFEHFPSEVGSLGPPSPMDFNGLMNSRLQPNMDLGYDMAVADSNNVIQSIITSNNVVPQERALPPIPRADFPPMECPGEGFFRNPEDCTRFYRCVHAMGLSWSVFHFMCPAGLVFDTNHNVCNWMNQAPPCLPG